MMVIIFFVGCKSVPVDPFDYQFQKSVDKSAADEKADTRKVSIELNNVPFSQAMGIISSEYHAPIVWASDLDKEFASGRFEGMPLPAVLSVLARRVKANVALVGGVYYLGEIRREDRAYCVLRVPPVERQQLLESVRQAASMDSAVSLVGSCLWICDNLESLRKVVNAIETLRERNERSYVAEVYFIRVNEQHFVDLSAELSFQRIDIFSSAFNINQLFEMFVDAEGSTGWAKITQRPVLYLSEGRKVTFTDGREITREQKSMTEQGAIETTGYQKFSDGTNLMMTLYRVSDKSYSVDIDLSVSSFDKNDKAMIPAMERSAIHADGLLVQDSQVYYIGSLRRDQHSSKGGLFSYNFSKAHDMITIWLRVRELKSSLP